MKPSHANHDAFDRAVEEIAHATQHLLDALVTTAPPKDRDAEAAKRKARSAARFATVSRTPPIHVPANAPNSGVPCAFTENSHHAEPQDPDTRLYSFCDI
jgi:hypothetical protein